MHVKDMVGKPTITLAGRVDWGMLGYLDSKLETFLRERNETNARQRAIELYVIISTPGGDMGAARTICERLRLLQKALPQLDCYGIGTGEVRSAGIPILMQFPQVRRLVSKETRLHFHYTRMQIGDINLSGELEARVSHHAVLDESIRLQKGDDDWMLRMIEQGWPIRPASIHNYLKGKTILQSQEAVSLGVVAGMLEED